MPISNPIHNLSKPTNNTYFSLPIQYTTHNHHFIYFPTSSRVPALTRYRAPPITTNSVKWNVTSTSINIECNDLSHISPQFKYPHNNLRVPNSKQLTISTNSQTFNGTGPSGLKTNTLNISTSPVASIQTRAVNAWTFSTSY